MAEQLYHVLHNGERQTDEPITHNQAFAFILRHQSASVDWAMKYERWAIVPADPREVTP